MKKIKVPRYYHYDELGDDTRASEKNLWIVCHGYGYLASFFKNKFEGIDLDKNHLVFPEAPNHFYKKGFDGRVGANWMTRHQRLDEIVNINAYLSALYHSLAPERYNKLILFGFSQGAYSIIRWIIDHEIACNELVIWGAKIADDYLDRFMEVQDKYNLHLVLGDADEFIEPGVAEKQLETYRSMNLAFNHLPYSGPHDILTKPLLELNQHF